MISIKDYLEAINYRVTGGDAYQWDAFGPNVRYMDAELYNDDGNLYASVNILFDTINQTVYQMEAWDYVKERAYRWINPMHLDDYKAECQRRGVDHTIASDVQKFVDLEIPADILDKARAITNQVAYDDRVQVELDLDDSSIFELMRLAHERDITLNKMVEIVLQEAIQHHKDLEEWQV